MTNCRPLTLAEAAAVFRDAFEYDPGHSDLDDEQPISVHVQLGDWRRLDRALSAITVTRPPKPKECEGGCPPRQVCDHCQWPRSTKDRG